VRNFLAYRPHLMRTLGVSQLNYVLRERELSLREVYLTCGISIERHRNERLSQRCRASAFRITSDLNLRSLIHVAILLPYTSAVFLDAY
jgi:hypothetical protein